VENRLQIIEGRLESLEELNRKRLHGTPDPDMVRKTWEKKAQLDAKIAFKRAMEKAGAYVSDFCYLDEKVVKTMLKKAKNECLANWPE